MIDIVGDNICDGMILEVITTPLYVKNVEVKNWLINALKLNGDIVENTKYQKARITPIDSVFDYIDPFCMIPLSLRCGYHDKLYDV